RSPSDCATGPRCFARSAPTSAKARPSTSAGRRCARNCRPCRWCCSAISVRTPGAASRLPRVCGCATISTSSSYNPAMDRIEQLRKFLAATPDDPFARYALALELKSKGDASAAAAELMELLGRKPDYLAAYLQLGMLLASLQRAGEAREILQRGQELARLQGNGHTLSELTQALETLPSQ